jgi:hydrogenase expression/formation protein HypE
MTAQKNPEDFNLSCPPTARDESRILLAHGGGGRLMHELLEKSIFPVFDNPFLARAHDSAQLEIQKVRFAFTTDSYVVHPIFFPGGDIGSLAVYGTVNDLAMSGAVPLYLSVGLILEEGFLVDDLRAITASMKSAADRTGVTIVTGDTKVVERGKADGLFINTSGIGVIRHPCRIGPENIQEGDVVLLNGDIGRHGMAVMAFREGISFESKLESDLAPLNGPVEKLLASQIEIHCLRDLTRGGLATGLNELARASGCGIRVEEGRITVREEVRGSCEILGLDPYYAANEGKFLAVVPERDAVRALEILRAEPGGNEAAIIGAVGKRTSAAVTLQSKLGTSRVLDMLSGEQLPRIC